MKLTYKSSKLTYKTLFGYSLVIITLLVVAVPVLANTEPGANLLDFSFKSETGNLPQTAQPLTYGLNLNHLNPGEENWYTYSQDSFNTPDLSWISLAMRYESEALIEADHVNFQVLTQKRDSSWLPQTNLPNTPLGAGLRSPLKTVNTNLIESFWTGQVANTEIYYVRVFNNSPFSLDYALEAKEEQPAVSGAIPAGFNSALSDAVPLNSRQLAWTLTAQAVENMKADEAAIWMQQAQHVGWIVTEGSSVGERPNPALANPHTLWALTAQAIEGQEATESAQWLIQADSLGWLAIPLGTVKNPNPVVGHDNSDSGEGADPPAQPMPPEAAYTPISIYPNNPLDLKLHSVNSGRLAPYGEHWYHLFRDDLDDELVERMALTMIFTPRQGYHANRVNFEIFPAGQYHIWARGDTDYMEHFGVGAWVSRDKDGDTGERLWLGSLVDGDGYLIKVKNGTADVIDYYLFPDDVENAELGNPTLHQLDNAAEAMPDAVSPGTRSVIQTP